LRVSEIKKINHTDEYKLKISAAKITAAWAFSEAALGGLLHALHIPFTGLMVGGVASIFISMIAYYSDKPEDILRSTIIVVIVKGVISPHTPLMAYIAVMGQGGIGYLIFRLINNHKLSTLLLSTITLTFFGFQKLIFLTIVFGNEFWNSINTFTNYIINQFIIDDASSSINISLIVIGAYGSVHILGGLVFGIISGNMPKNLMKIKNYLDEQKIKPSDYIDDVDLPIKRKKKKNKKYFFGIILIAILVSSYLIPEAENQSSTKIVVMFIRSIIILFLWFTFLGPLLRRGLNKYISKKKSLYADEIGKIIDIFPIMKSIAAYSWKQSKKSSGMRKFKTFFILLFGLLLFDERIDG
jgi:hypothetical protein